MIDVFALRAIYDRHTRQHHQYFTDNEPTIDTVKEFRIVFFPWRVLLVLGVGGSASAPDAQAINPNAGYVVFITMIGQYMVYETFHFCCHVHGQRLRAQHALRQHDPPPSHGAPQHGDHDALQHEPHLPDRGLVHGHLRPEARPARPPLQWLRQSHVKDELKPIIERFRIDDSRVTLDGPQLTDEELRALGSTAVRTLRARTHGVAAAGAAAWRPAPLPAEVQAGDATPMSDERHRRFHGSRFRRRGKPKPRQRAGGRSLTDEAYAQLEELIVTLQLRPGVAVSEATLSERLGIGRTPIREALQRLAREHLVVVLPQRGNLISEIDVRKQLRLLETRREVERLIVRWAARRRRPRNATSFASSRLFSRPPTATTPGRSCAATSVSTISACRRHATSSLPARSA